jgi:cytidylate kinase
MHAPFGTDSRIPPLDEPGRLWQVARMSKSVVCISRTVAAGGETIGRMVAERLGFRYVDEEVLTRASEKAHVNLDLVAEEEHRKSILTRILDALASSPTVDAYLPVPSEGVYYMLDAAVVPTMHEDLRALIREAIAEIAAQGSAVIVAHAASMALAGRPEVLRVLVTASEKTRASRLPGGLSESDSLTSVRDSDRDRRDYLKRFYEIKEELPTHYDLVLNTDALKPEQAVDVIIAAARS